MGMTKERLAQIREEVEAANGGMWFFPFHEQPDWHLMASRMAKMAHEILTELDDLQGKLDACICATEVAEEVQGHLEEVIEILQGKLEASKRSRDFLENGNRRLIDKAVALEQKLDAAFCEIGKRDDLESSLRHQIANLKRELEFQRKSVRHYKGALAHSCDVNIWLAQQVLYCARGECREECPIICNGENATVENVIKTARDEVGGNKKTVWRTKRRMWSLGKRENPMGLEEQAGDAEAEREEQGDKEETETQTESREKIQRRTIGRYRFKIR